MDEAAPRVLFLDVDGVLNTVGVDCWRNTSRACEHSAVMPAGAPGQLKRVLLCRLREVLRLTRAKIVLSSNWRTCAAARRALQVACVSVGIPHRLFIGQTFEIRRPMGAASRRTREIDQWLERNRIQFGVEQWAAIDDMDLVSAWPEVAEHLVQTDPILGISETNAAQIVQILGAGCESWLCSSLREFGKTLVLDIDGALIDSLPKSEACTLFGGRLAPHHVDDDDDCIFARPCLQEFLDFCFAKFDGVGIWTASSQRWADTVVDHVLGRHRPWSFIWCGDRCVRRFSVLRDSIAATEISTKPLRKVWRSAVRKGMGFSRRGSLIVEDTPANCAGNLGNALYVSSFRVAASWDPVRNIVKDDALAYLMSLLEAAVLPCDDVRVAMRTQRQWSLGVEPTSSACKECPVCDDTRVLLRDPCPLCSE